MTILNALLCVVRQVVELISSAIGDVVQGLYYENYSNSEVSFCLSFLKQTWQNRDSIHIEVFANLKYLTRET